MENEENLFDFNKDGKTDLNDLMFLTDNENEVKE